MARLIRADYPGKNPVLLSVLKGSFIFLADLLRELYVLGLTDVEVDFMTVSSYGKGKEHQGSKVVGDITLDLNGKDVIVIEDIVDTGNTLAFIKDHLSAKNPASVTIATLLDKKEKREVEIDVKYIGFAISGTPWVEGYGLDGGLYGRGRPDIVEVSP